VICVSRELLPRGDRKVFENVLDHSCRRSLGGIHVERVSATLAAAGSEAGSARKSKRDSPSCVEGLAIAGSRQSSSPAFVADRLPQAGERELFAIPVTFA
jgi:hypothetical protein